MEMITHHDWYGGAKEDDDDYHPPPLTCCLKRWRRSSRITSLCGNTRFFKQAAGKTAKSILSGRGGAPVRVHPAEVQGYHRPRHAGAGKAGRAQAGHFLRHPGQQRQFPQLPCGDAHTQAFQELYYQADKVHGGQPAHSGAAHVRRGCERCFTGQLCRLQATMRSRNIMATIILQNISQLKALFKDDWGGHHRATRTR